MSEKPKASASRRDEQEESPETLAAIDAGLRDAEEGRVVSEEKVRELVREWTSAGFRKKGSSNAKPT